MSVAGTSTDVPATLMSAAPEPPGSDVQAEFGAFFHESYSRVVHYLMKLGAPRDDAEEAAQEAMLALFQRWDSVDRPGGYLYTVAARALTRKLQDRARWHHADWNRASAGSDDALDGLAASGHAEEDPAEDLDAESMVVRLMSLLPPQQRAVIALHYDGFSTAEIAERLALSTSTVRTNLQRGRERLRKELAAIEARDRLDDSR